LTDPKVTQERKEEKESHKLKQQIKELQSALNILSVKHNTLLDAVGKIGLNIQIVCAQNKFQLSKA
jgi:hypothetical protein|tara:strand:+ start:1367 stop:1564 length:198 start_codon:yes stop_codon:yes gene_type:complete